MKKIIVIGTVFGALMLCTAAFAAGPIGERQQNQQHRIHQGVRSGQITKQELRHLRHDQKDIRAAKHHAFKDGYLSPREKARISRMQNEASHDIRRAKTNDRYYSQHYDRRHRVQAVPRYVPVPCHTAAPVVRPGGFLGVSVVQPGWSLSWSSVTR